MGYEFSWSAFGLGIVILVVGGLIVMFYRPISDNLTGGVAGYEKTRLWGLIISGLGIIIMLNLHAMILEWIFGSIF